MRRCVADAKFMASRCWCQSSGIGSAAGARGVGAFAVLKTECTCTVSSIETRATADFSGGVGRR